MSSRFKKLSVVVVISLLGVIGYLTFLSEKPTPFNSEYAAAQRLLTQAPTGGDFSLQSNQGAVSLNQFRGQWVLLYFGYTYCPDICPTNLGNLTAAYRRLSQTQQDQVQILFISVDPDRDTPEKLAEYVHFFNKDIIGLTGSKTLLDDIAQRYGVVYALHKTADNQENYSVDHSAFTYFINPQGELVKQLPHGTNPQQFKNAIEQALKTN